MEDHRRDTSKKRVFNYPRNSILFKLYNWLSGRHWWILGFAALILFALETFDFYRHHGDFTHVIEFVIYIGLLLVVGVLVDLLISEIAIQNQTRKILDFKHALSLDLAGYHDWDGLLDQVTRFPDSVAPVSQACLFLSDTMSGQFVPVTQWSCEETPNGESCANDICEECLKNDLSSEVNFCFCDHDAAKGKMNAEAKKYLLLIRYGGGALGILQFFLDPGTSLSESQIEIFENVGDELGIALKAGQERQAVLQMSATETALAERREVSHYLHDHLGQSLGYLHIKMDQLIIDKDQLTLEDVFDDLEPMRKAVNDSYEIVRGILETIHSETTPSLTNLLMEHARKISERANFEIDFKTRGKPVPLHREVERAVFYAFEESLSNAEKHARATRIDIMANWRADRFTLTIADDGVGFDPTRVDTDQHFGMEILNERISKVNGRITVTTSENSGTIVNIDVPKSSADGMGRGGSL